jgi:hypothetical protein
MKCKQVQDLDTAQQKTPGQKLVSKQAEKKPEILEKKSKKGTCFFVLEQAHFKRSLILLNIPYE